MHSLFSVLVRYSQGKLSQAVAGVGGLGWWEREKGAVEGRRDVSIRLAADFRSSLSPLSLRQEVVSLSKTLFPLFALALGLPRQFFDDKVRSPLPFFFRRARRSRLIACVLLLQTQTPAVIMRPLFYPPESGPHDNQVLGIGAHSD